MEKLTQLVFLISQSSQGNNVLTSPIQNSSDFLIDKEPEARI